MAQPMTDRETRLNLIAQTASVCVASVLVCAKLWAVWMTGSLSIAAALADSGLDLAMSLTGLAAVRYAQRPPDDDHAFGHSSAEDLAALAQSAVLVLVALGIAGAAIARLGEPSELRAEGVGIAVMALSVVLTGGLVALQTSVARETANRVILADRLHYLADLLPNLGALAALWVSSAFGTASLDSIIALCAAGLLIVGAVRIGSGAWDALMDRAAPDDLLADICAIAAAHPGIAGFHDLRTRTAGSRVFVNIHLEIDGTLPLSEAHAIGEGLRAAILERHPRADVMIHHDPV